MPKYRYDINGMQFNSKKSVIEYVRETIYNKYPDFQELSADHLRFMIGLLRYHPWGDQKIGIGIKKIWIQSNDKFPTKCFWLERIDETKTDFSFHQCVSPSSLLRDFKEACRRAIAALVIDFRKQYFHDKNKAICPILGKPMTIFTSHVDHMPPNTFEKIINEFIEMLKIDIEKVPLINHGDGNIGNYFADITFEKNWVNFHNERAKLRVISAEANLGI